MKFSGFWVGLEDGAVKVIPTEFDETDLDPQTGWKEAWQNQDAESQFKGYVESAAAIRCAAQLLGRLSGVDLPAGELEEILHARPLYVEDGFRLKDKDDLLLLARVLTGRAA